MSENFNSHIACEGTDNDINWVYGIDMTQMIMNKLVKNAEKYPAK